MASAAYPNRLHTPDGRAPAVAVVDGNAASAIVTSLLVEQFGCTTFTAGSGEAALALLRRKSDIDLVLIDLSIPDMDGVIAAFLIRETAGHRDTPIVPLVSGRDDVRSPRSRAARFSSAVAKPYSPRELYAVMEATLARTRSSAAAVAPSGSG